MINKIVFLVSRPNQYIEHVIIVARDREFAKSHASHILGGDPDHYVVTPLTSPGTRTIFLLEAS